MIACPGLGIVRPNTAITRKKVTKKMDKATSDVARAVAGGATNIKAVIDATGLSRLKVERALNSLEKQKWLVRDGQGFRAPGVAAPQAPQEVRDCGSCTS